MKVNKFYDINSILCLGLNTPSGGKWNKEENLHMNIISFITPLLHIRK